MSGGGVFGSSTKFFRKAVCSSYLMCSQTDMGLDKSPTLADVVTDN